RSKPQPGSMFVGRIANRRVALPARRFGPRRPHWQTSALVLEVADIRSEFVPEFTGLETRAFVEALTLPVFRAVQRARESSMMNRLAVWLLIGNELALS